MRFSVASLLWLMGCVALLVGLTTALGFTGLVVSSSLILVALVGQTAPRSTWFQKFLVALFGWGGGLVGWCLMSVMGNARVIGHTWWRAEADTVAAFGSGSLAVAIAAYLVFCRGERRTMEKTDNLNEDW